MTRIETAIEVQNVRTEAQYRAKFLVRLKALGIDETPQKDALRAHLNAGRWVTPCVCGSSVALHPLWRFAGCLGCGRSWSTFIFPTRQELDAIDAVLSQRPARPGHAIPYRFYSWTPGETVADLE